MTAVAVVGAALVVGGMGLIWLLRTSLTDQLRTTAELRARDVADLLAVGTPPDGLAIVNDEESLIQVVDQHGRVVAASHNVEGEPPLARIDPGDTRVVSRAPVGDGSPLLVVATSVDTPGGMYTVLVGRSTEIVSESTRLLATTLLGGVPVLLGLVAVVAWRLVGAALAPVSAIRREVDRITASELHRRVPVPAHDAEIHQLARTMNRMLDRLEAADRRQRQFISDASHELRSPVATIRQHAEVARAHPGQFTVTELAEIVLAEDLRVQQLVEDLLLLARSGEGALLGSRVPVDLDDLALEEARRIRATTPLKVDTSGIGAARVLGDPSSLLRALRNLTGNAERYARSTVRVTVGTQGAWAVVTVEDDGPGVPEPDRERVFERFVRLDDARSRDAGGAGLGLAIVREVIVAHGGTVRAGTSDLGGARFEIRLPVADD